MDLVVLGEVELRYTSLDALDYGGGGQFYGTMEGAIQGDRLRGSLRLTNLAPKRPDNVNLPTLRGLLTTDNGAMVFVEMNGIATLRPEDGARVFVTSLTFRTGDSRYEWLNTTVGILEGVLESVSVLAVARGRAYHCKPTISTPELAP